MIEVPKNAREVYRLERQLFLGHDLLNIRVFFDDGTGEYRPGKQGIAVRVERLPELLAAIQSLATSMEAA